jgi:Cu-Zn family superoxide dismutase
METRRPFIAATAGVALLVMLAAGVANGQATHASGTFHDPDGREVGWVKLVEDGSGVVHVAVHVDGIVPGRHGIHIHSVGACTPTFAAAGGHYNPFGHQHGLENPDGPHAGDLPNLVVSEAGIGHLEAKTDLVTVTDGPATLFDSTVGAVGSSFIIHANEDDQQTDATNGNSGARIACAVIEAG